MACHLNVQTATCQLANMDPVEAPRPKVGIVGAGIAGLSAGIAPK